MVVLRLQLLLLVVLRLRVVLPLVSGLLCPMLSSSAGTNTWVKKLPAVSLRVSSVLPLAILMWFVLCSIYVGVLEQHRPSALERLELSLYRISVTSEFLYQK